MKFCKKCKLKKNFEFFSLNRKSKDGLQNVCKQCVSLFMAEYRLKNRDEINKKTKQYREANKEKYKLAIVRWKKENHKKMIERSIAREKERKIEDEFFAFRKNLKRSISQSFQKIDCKPDTPTQKILGCSYAFFKKHIEIQFKKGMTWENRGDWHIDHIIPQSKAKTKEDLIRLNHFTNLRPIWSKENLQKSNKDIFLI